MLALCSISSSVARLLSAAGLSPNAPVDKGHDAAVRNAIPKGRCILPRERAYHKVA